MKDEGKQTRGNRAFILHPSYFILPLEPVAQMDESASLRSLRSHVRVVPGSFVVRGRLREGRLPLKQAMKVRVLPPEFMTKSVLRAGVA